MGRLTRTIFIVGAIASMSPVLDSTAGGGDQAATALKTAALQMAGKVDPQAMAQAAGSAMRFAQQISELDPQTRKLMLELAGAGLAQASGRTASQPAQKQPAR